MAFSNDDMQQTIDELLSQPRGERVDYLQGLLMGMQYNTLVEAFTTMRAAADSTDLDDDWRAANATSAQVVYSYLEVLADADEIEETDRFWRL